jgi:hypothetical protein
MMICNVAFLLATDAVTGSSMVELQRGGEGVQRCDEAQSSSAGVKGIRQHEEAGSGGLVQSFSPLMQ